MGELSLRKSFQRFSEFPARHGPMEFVLFDGLTPPHRSCPRAGAPPQLPLRLGDGRLANNLASTHGKMMV